MTKVHSKLFRKTLENGHEIIVDAHVEKFMNQAPYFAITYDELSKAGRTLTCGTNHETVIDTFPELSRYTRWHLCSPDGPMHYLANGMYFLSKGEIDNFKSSVIWGALDDDSGQTLETNDDVKKYLIERWPKLIELFQRDMVQLFGEEIE